MFLLQLALDRRHRSAWAPSAPAMLAWHRGAGRAGTFLRHPRHRLRRLPRGHAAPQRTRVGQRAGALGYRGAALSCGALAWSLSDHLRLAGGLLDHGGARWLVGSIHSLFGPEPEAAPAPARLQAAVVGPPDRTSSDSRGGAVSPSPSSCLQARRLYLDRGRAPAPAATLKSPTPRGAVMRRSQLWSPRSSARCWAGGLVRHAGRAPIAVSSSSSSAEPDHSAATC